MVASPELHEVIGSPTTTRDGPTRTGPREFGTSLSWAWKTQRYELALPLSGPVAVSERTVSPTSPCWRTRRRSSAVPMVVVQVPRKPSSAATSGMCERPNIRHGPIAPSASDRFSSTTRRSRSMPPVR